MTRGFYFLIYPSGQKCNQVGEVKVSQDLSAGLCPQLAGASSSEKASI